MKIRTLLVDDQATGLAVLRDLLSCEPDIEIIGTAGGGQSGVESINQLAPDLVFLDVQMPVLDGFEVLARIKLPQMPVIIFVTAHADFALKAFEAHALDYLIKPCGLERLRSAVQRARQQIQSKHNSEIQQKLESLLHDLKADSKSPARLPVKSNGHIVFLRLTDIDLVEGADNYVRLYAGKETHMLRETMAAFEEKLPPDQFVRISRSAIVNIESVKELHPLFHGEYTVSLRNGARVTLTRTYREQLRRFGVPA